MTIDEQFARIVRQELAGLRDEMITLRQDIEETIGKLQFVVRDPDPDPDPGEITQDIEPPQYLRADRERFFIYLDPADETTWGPDRKTCRLELAGNRWSPGDWTDNVLTHEAERFANKEGWGLKFEKSPNGLVVRSFTMEDGDDRRLYTETIDGRRYLVGAGTFIPAGGTYEYIKGVTDRDGYPDMGDRRFHDGVPRIQLVQGDEHIAVGADADEVMIAGNFRTPGSNEGKSWFLANDYTVFFHEVHAPGSGFSSPLLCQVIDGKFIVWSLETKTGGYARRDIADLNGQFRRRQVCSFDVRDLDTDHTIIMRYRIAPKGGSFSLRRMRDDGQFEELHSERRALGYAFGDVADEEFEAHVHKLYQFHRWQPPSLAGPGDKHKPGRFPYNWDRMPGLSNIRRIRTGFAVASYNDDVTLDEMEDTCRSFMLTGR